MDLFDATRTATRRTAAAVGRRLRRMAGTAKERGASALEFAIIAAIVVVLASIIGGVVYKIVSDKSKNLKDCANQPIGTACSGGAGGP